MSELFSLMNISVICITVVVVIALICNRPYHPKRIAIERSIHELNNPPSPPPKNIRGGITTVKPISINQSKKPVPKGIKIQAKEDKQ